MSLSHGRIVEARSVNAMRLAFVETRSAIRYGELRGEDEPEDSSNDESSNSSSSDSSSE